VGILVVYAVAVLVCVAHTQNKPAEVSHERL
jgi:hypothetical protein